MSSRCYSRSQAAFLLSCDRLFGLGKPVYFWTVTFVNVHHEWEYPILWHKFVRTVELAHGWRQKGFMRGLRVIEPHESHGLHYHMMINRRVSIHVMRRVGARFGMGRISVVRCDKGAGTYLVKYLGKSKEFATRIRSWGSVGGFRCCRVNDVEIDSPFHRNKDVLYGHGGKASIVDIGRLLAYSVAFGDLAKWPLRDKLREMTAAVYSKRLACETSVRLAQSVPTS